MSIDAKPDYLSSASALIKHLRAPHDPPQDGLPSKIDAALDVWKNNDVYIPRKADVLKEWVLDALLKANSSKKVGLNPLLEPKYYELLYLTWSQSPNLVTPPLSLLASFFRATREVGNISLDLLDSAVQAFELIWKDIEQVKSEQWLDVWKSCLEYLSSPTTLEKGATERGRDLWQRLLQLVHELRGRITFASESDEKKFAVSLHPTLTTLLAARHRNDILSLSSNELFLSPASLKGFEPLQPILTSLTPLQNQPEILTYTLTTFLPHLLKDVISQFSKHRYIIFSQPSSSTQPYDVFVSDKLQSAVQSALKEILDFLVRLERSSSPVPAGDIWTCRQSLWTEIETWGGYLETDQAWSILLSNQTTSAKEALQNQGADGGNPQVKILQLLNTLETLDHNAAEIGEDVLSWCLAAPKVCHDSATDLLISCLRYHQLTYSLPHFINTIIKASEALFPTSLDSQTIRQLYSLITEGPLSSTSLQQRLRNVISGSLASSPLPDLLDACKLSQQAQDDHLANGEDGNSSKKRKHKRGIRLPSAALLALQSRLLATILSSVKSASSETLEPLQDIIHTTEENRRVVDISEPEKHKKSKKGKNREIHPQSTLSDESWVDDVLLAAQQRLGCHLERLTRDVGSHLIGPLEALFPILTSDMNDSHRAYLIETRIETLRYLSQHYSLLASVGQEIAPGDVEEFLSEWFHLLCRKPRYKEGDQSPVDTAEVIDETWRLFSQEGIYLFAQYGSLQDLKEVCEQIGRALNSEEEYGDIPMASARQILCRAETWELPQIKGAFTELFQDIVNSFDDDVPDILLNLANMIPINVISEEWRNGLVGIFTRRSFPWNSENGQDPTETDDNEADAWMTIHQSIQGVHWMNRLGKNHSALRATGANFVLHVIRSRDMPSRSQEDKEAVMRLLTTLFGHLLRDKNYLEGNSSADCLPKILNRLLSCLSSTGQASLGARMETVTDISFCFLAVVMENSTRLQNYGAEIREKMESLIPKLITSTQDALMQITGVEANSDTVKLLNGWITLLRCRREFDLQAEMLPLSQHTLRRLMNTQNTLREPKVLPLLVQTMHEEAGGAFQQQTLAMYILASSRTSTAAAESVMSKVLSQAELDGYSEALDSTLGALKNALENHQVEKKLLVAYIETIGMILGIPREGSGKSVRKYCSSLLDVFQTIVCHPDLDTLAATARCLERLVSSRARIFRPTDVFTICQIISTVLLPYPVTDRPASTRIEIYDSVIAILDSLVRQRPDLVVAAASEVVGILCSIWPLFLESRRAFSATSKGRARVTSRWPKWMAESMHPQVSTTNSGNGSADIIASFGVHQAESLSRLLTSLTKAKLDNPNSSNQTKSIKPRSTLIAPSLVKHVPSILVTYCRTVADPFGGLSRAVRKILEPGLWSICDILTVGGRVNARGREGEGIGIPFGLGEGGEVESEVWAAMWLDWNKKRYTGKG